MSGKRVLLYASITLVAVVIIVGAGFGGVYYLAISALHNHSNLSVQQSCSHWETIWRATAAGPARLHAAAAQIINAQLRCPQ